MNSSYYAGEGAPRSVSSTFDSTHMSLSSALVDVGIFKDTLLPSLGLHSSFALIAYAVAGRSSNPAEARDWLWPTAQVANAWWSAVGHRVYSGLSPSRAVGLLSRPERLLLGGVTLWGGRLLYGIATRSAKEAPLEEAKRGEGSWNQELLTTLLSEAMIQSVVSLPFTAPFRHQGAVLSGYHPYIQALAVGMFSTGFALGVLADAQQQQHEATSSSTGLLRDGVRSIVRHPKYLGDALIHFSFPVLLYGSDMLAPIELLGPLVNYMVLRYISGREESKATEEVRSAVSSRVGRLELEEYQSEVNAFWPDSKQLSNNWTWVVLGCGAAGFALEQAMDMLF